MRQFNGPFLIGTRGSVSFGRDSDAVDHKGSTLLIWLHAILFRQSRYFAHFFSLSTRNDEVLRVWKSIRLRISWNYSAIPLLLSRKRICSCLRSGPSPHKSTYARLQIDFVSRRLLFGPTSSPLPSKCSTAGQESNFFISVVSLPVPSTKSGNSLSWRLFQHLPHRAFRDVTLISRVQQLSVVLSVQLRYCHLHSLATDKYTTTTFVPEQKSATTVRNS